MNFDQKYICNRNMISTIIKKLVSLQGLACIPPNLVNFGPETAENGWRVFAHLLNFRIGTLPAIPHPRYITDSRHTLARVMYSTGLQSRTNAGRAHASLCHASSLFSSQQLASNVHQAQFLSWIPIAITITNTASPCLSKQRVSLI